MHEEHKFSVQAFWIILIMNALLLGAAYMVAGEVLRERDQLIGYLVIWAVITVNLWLLVRLYARRMARAIEQRLAAAPTTEPTVPAPVSPPASTMETPREAAAIQMLSILQRQGRLIDFLQENLSLYEDAQIGAAVRSVHAGCKTAVDEHVELAPIYQEAEGSRVAVQPGFDAHAVRLSGSVSGDPPFHGTLQHRGWRVVKIDLPTQTPAQANAKIVAPAEVEVQG